MYISTELNDLTFYWSSVQFSRSVLSGSLWSHGLQHARFLCPSLSPRICSHLCPLSQWCYPAISSSVVPFSSCPQSFPVSGSFIVSQLFTSGCQSIGVSASVLCCTILFFTVSDFTFITRHNHSCASFLLWPSLLILYGAISLLFPSSILDTYQAGGSSSIVISFCLFILFMGFFRQEYWSTLPFPLQRTTFCQNSPPWPVSDVALHSMVHSFLELHKAVIHVIIWLAFCDCGFHTQHGWNLKTFCYVKQPVSKRYRTYD